MPEPIVSHLANKNGVMANDTFTATITPTPNTASSGRVTVTPAGALMRKLVLYIVSASQARAMSTEAESSWGLLGGEFLAQTLVTFSAASLDGTAVGYGVGSDHAAVERSAGTRQLGQVRFILDRVISKPQFGFELYKPTRNEREAPAQLRFSAALGPVIGKNT